MKGPRDYQAEYARRIDKALAQGRTRSEGRGHRRSPTVDTKSGKKLKEKKVYDPRLEDGLKQIRNGVGITKAASTIGVSSERLRSYITQTGVVRKRGRRWVVQRDHRRRELFIYSEGTVVAFVVRNYVAAADVGRYHAAVGQFLKSNDPAFLTPFAGQFVTDVNNKSHYYETRPNVIHRLVNTRSESFEQIYRIVV